MYSNCDVFITDCLQYDIKLAVWSFAHATLRERERDFDFVPHLDALIFEFTFENLSVVLLSFSSQAGYLICLVF